MDVNMDFYNSEETFKARINEFLKKTKELKEMIKIYEQRRDEEKVKEIKDLLYRFNALTLTEG